MSQIDMLRNMEKDFQITRKIFLNIKTGWFDNSKSNSNLVSATDISINQIQGRYRLNLTDNKLKIQEFFFDLEWSSFTEDGKKIEVLTRSIVDSYFPRLKKATKRLLFILFKYIPKEYIYIRVSGSGLHIILFLKGLRSMDEWKKITEYLIYKSRLPNTKNANNLVFGLDKYTILSSDRKIAEFGSWNKLKKELKGEVDYLNYAAYLTVDEFFKTKHYPFCNSLNKVKYPQYESIVVPPKLLRDSKTEVIVESEPINTKSATLNRCAEAVLRDQISFPESSPAFKLSKCPAYLSILRKRETEWYERHFLVKFLKYILRLSKEDILELIDKYNCWSDYNKKTTAYYVKKHFREGTCETKVKKPPKKKTLIKYELCKDDCEGCVYNKIKQQTDITFDR